jgi:GntR family transcriptional regulator
LISDPALYSCLNPEARLIALRWNITLTKAWSWCKVIENWHKLSRDGVRTVSFSFQIDQKSGIPIYIQIMDQIKHLIASGALQSGQQLPTIRELAVDLTINLHTVAHAYAELEREGFLTIQRGRGTFITNGHTGQELEDLRVQKLQALVENMFAEVLHLGYEADEVEQALTAQIEQWRTTAEQPVTDKGKE